MCAAFMQLLAESGVGRIDEKITIKYFDVIISYFYCLVRFYILIFFLRVIISTEN